MFSVCGLESAKLLSLKGKLSPILLRQKSSHCTTLIYLQQVELVSIWAGEVLSLNVVLIAVVSLQNPLVHLHQIFPVI